VEAEPPDVWADVLCTNTGWNEAFAVVADDLVAETRLQPNDMMDAVRRTLRKWQWFWGIDASGLSTDGALGLFGELWFIDRWAPFPAVLATWLGPTGSRHDFVSPAVSVEVKATRIRSDGPVRHRITSLDQLDDPESGVLFLFSLSVVPDPIASNSLPVLIARLRARLDSETELLELLDRRLAAAGWTPAAAERHAQPFRVTAEELYAVRPDFPRLVRASFPVGLPVGVDQLTYTVDLAACQAFRVARQPADGESLVEDLRP
jgi:hypothetical protein